MEKVLLNRNDIEKITSDIAEKVYREITDIDKFAIIGIQTRGVELAERIRGAMEEMSGKQVNHGILDITFHRDDLVTRGVLPVIKETRIDFDIADMTILLVDDVLYTGRTVKAALETLTTFGRPRAIRLFVLVDRGNREMPIQPDYCGHRVDSRIEDKVKVRLSLTDNVDDEVRMVHDEGEKKKR